MNSKVSKLKIKNNIDIILLIDIIILICFGLIMVLSASAPTALERTKNSYTYFKSQLMAAGLGVIFMFVAIKLNYHFYCNVYLGTIIYVLSILSIFLVKVPGIGLSTNGAQRWVSINGFSFQPSEITKLGVIISLSVYLSSKKYTEWKNSPKKVVRYLGLLSPFIGIILPAGLIYIVQNHFSAAVIILVVGFVMILMSGMSLKDFGKLCITGLAIFAIGFPFLKKEASKSFRAARLDAWFHPEETKTTTGYQSVQSLYAIGSGKLFGVGLGKSKQKYLYLPEAHNDFIFAIIGEELGFVGCLFVIGLFVIYWFRGMAISVNAKDKTGTCLATRNNNNGYSSSIIKYSSCNRISSKHRYFFTIY